MRVQLWGYNVLITDDDGRQHWRKHLEHARDPFVLAECDEGHTYVMPRQEFRWGTIPECPKCVDVAGRQAA